MDIRAIITEVTQKALKELDLEVGEVYLEHPADLSYGDYSTNIALVQAQRSGANPKELAEEILRYIVQHKTEEIEKVEVAGPGFINFYVSQNFFTNSIKEILQKNEAWGKNQNLAGTKVMVEYTDPNPFKEFHIGHLMSNSIGESISRLIEFSDADVKRANYYGDVGLHVAKAIWGKINSPELSWGEAYALGSAQYEDHKIEIDELNKKIYEKSDPNVNSLYVEGRKESLSLFEKIYKKLGTTFDFDFPESTTWRNGEVIVRENTKIFNESEGAIVFHGENYGLHTRVFITREGLPTYETKELGLLQAKLEAYPFDTAITITASEQKEYFKVVLAAAKQIEELAEIAEKTVHITHGMMRLPTGKMSSRTGDVVAAGHLIEGVSTKVRGIINERDIEDKKTVAEQIAIGALKYWILKQATGRDIIFDEEKALSFEGASGPYLQYAHTRAQSVLQKAGKKTMSTTLPENWNTTLLEKLLHRFPEIVERAGKEYEPHYVATYLTELASAFGNFYAHERILDADERERGYKLALVRAFQITMKNGLWLLGIEVPLRM